MVEDKNNNIHASSYAEIINLLKTVFETLQKIHKEQGARLDTIENILATRTEKKTLSTHKRTK